MEKISIIPADNAVYINGELRVVDCSGMDPAIHAVQWCHCPKRNKSKGEIEWVQDPLSDHKPNSQFDDMKAFQAIVDAWHEAPDEEARHERIRADKQVARAEEVLADVKKWPEGIKKEVDSKTKALREVEAELAERKKQRDDVYAGKLKCVKPSGDL